MMKVILIFIFLLIRASALFSYENSLPSLESPTELRTGDLSVDLSHRLFDDVFSIPERGYFGGGASVYLGLRYMFIDQLEAHTGFHTLNNEADIGISYAKSFAQYFKSQADMTFFSFQNPGTANRNQNFFFLLSAQNDLLSDIIILTLNVGWDLYYESLGTGLGLSFKLNDSLHLIAEYALPLYYNFNSFDGKVQYYSISIKLDTIAHEFIFTAGNGTGIGVRDILTGAGSFKNLFFGFSIRRLFEFF